MTGKKPGLVGLYIREKREKLGLSQRALGQKFTPPVTTQFISNVERGVTPLPPVHVPTLIQALQVTEAEFFAVMEREYSQKLSGKLGREGEVARADIRALVEGLASSITDLTPEAVTRIRGAIENALRAEGKSLKS